jgi:lysophospholipase L1-like esterase
MSRELHLGHPARRAPRILLALLLMAAAALLTLAGTARTASAAPAAADAAAPTRIMPLGDSITGSPGCWRALLWNKLQDAGYTNIDFVGTLPPQGCGVPYDGDNEGHGGILATNIASQNQLPAWLSATSPDIVLMHLGTNDVWSNIAPAKILDAFTTMVGQMRASNPDMKVLVAQILPMNPANCAECAQRVVDFNAQIPAWAKSVSTAQSPVTVVDQWTGFDDATDTVDGVHPNDAGIAKMSAKWYPPLAALLTSGESSVGGTTGGTSEGTSSGTTTGTTTGTTAGTSTGTTTGTSVGGTSGGTTSGTTVGATSGGSGNLVCTVVLTVVNSWPGGYQANVVITCTAPVTSWEVTIDGAQISQIWGAGAATSSGTSTVVHNAAWNGAISAGGSTSFGFIATGSPSPVPAVQVSAS